LALLLNQLFASLPVIGYPFALDSDC